MSRTQLDKNNHTEQASHVWLLLSLYHSHQSSLPHRSFSHPPAPSRLTPYKSLSDPSPVYSHNIYTILFVCLLFLISLFPRIFKSHIFYCQISTAQNGVCMWSRLDQDLQNERRNRSPGEGPAPRLCSRKAGSTELEFGVDDPWWGSTS